MQAQANGCMESWADLHHVSWMTKINHADKSTIEGTRSEQKPGSPEPHQAEELSYTTKPQTKIHQSENRLTATPAHKPVSPTHLYKSALPQLDEPLHHTSSVVLVWLQGF